LDGEAERQSDAERSAAIRKILDDPSVPTIDERVRQQIREQQKSALVEVRAAFEELSPDVLGRAEHVRISQRLIGAECREIEQDIRDIRREIIRAFNSLDDRDKRDLLAGPRGRKLVALMES